MIAKPLRPLSADGFDFLFGTWQVRHRKLQARLASSQDWIEFPGTLQVWSLLGGLGNLDDNVLEDPQGRYLASSVRMFDPSAGLWSIYWVDGRAPEIGHPLVGRFEGRVGHFVNEDIWAGRPVRVRFTYEDVRPGVARWSQAFSPDAGRSWETHWTMDFERNAVAKL